MRLRRLVTFFAAVTLPVALLVPSPVEASAAAPLMIGVDHLDSAHQQIDPKTGAPLQGGEVWTYTDFFSRSVSVHQGNVLDFNFAGPGHVIGLAKDEAAARNALPLFATDGDDGRLATGSGAAPLLFAPFALQAFLGGGGPPACGAAANPCNFTGAFDPTMLGTRGNWFVQVNAPVGDYSYLCFVHPGMSGTLKVVGDSQHATTQSQVNHRSEEQFENDREQAAQAEAKANKPRFWGEEPGSRTYLSYVGLSAAHNHVGLFEMLPRHLNLVQGDKVRFVWQYIEAHTVTFPSTFDPALFGPDCAPPDQVFGTIPNSGGVPACGDSPTAFPEILLDTGSSPPGTALTTVDAQVDSGILIGAGYGVPGSVQNWSLSTNSSTATTGDHPFNYHCAIHDWMFATIDVRASESE